MKHKVDALDWSKSFMYSIHQTHFLVEKRLEQTLDDADGVSFSQFLILLALHCTKEASQTDIADFLYLTEATVSRHITTLTDEGYIARKEDPENRRKHILTMTAKGQRAFEAAHEIIVAVLKEIFDDVPLKDRSNISKTFERVATKLLRTQE